MQPPSELAPSSPRESSDPWRQGLLLLLWIAIGAGLRLMFLDSKPPWTDEFATLVFSLGNSFTSVPLDQVISLKELLQPLQTNPQASVATVVQRVLTEDVHPPLYFALSHLWLDRFSTGELVSIWAARALPALLGVLSIPAVYGLGRFAFRSCLVGQLAAASMAVSPYGVFLAQEARHYTLGVLWVIASLVCLVTSVRRLQQQKPLPVWMVLLWVGTNALGLATHYFFGLTLAAEAIVLLRVRFHPQQSVKDGWRLWGPIYAVALGTVVAGLVWLPFLLGIQSNDMTQWIRSGDRSVFITLINPIAQALAAWLTMLVLLPVEATSLVIAILSGLGMLVFLVWAVPRLRSGLLNQWQNAESRLGLQVLGGFVGATIALFFTITYGLGTDLTRGARYNFVYFPAVMVLLGASLAALWMTKSGKKIVALIWVVGLASGLTVACNLGYQKYYRPDLIAPQIAGASQAPLVIVTAHHTLVQVGELLGLGLELHQLNLPTPPQFFLAHQDCNAKVDPVCPAPTATLQATLQSLPRPVDLGLLNFFAFVGSQRQAEEQSLQTALVQQNCLPDAQAKLGTDGYEYALYHCST